MNKAILIGHLNKDVEISYTHKNTPCVRFSLATVETVGEQSRTEWHRVVAFGLPAQTCEQGLKKGQQLYIEGKARKKTWEKDGVQRYITEIVAMRIVPLGMEIGAGVNKAIIIGRLGAKPEIRYTQEKLAVATLSIATNEKNGDNVETQWHRVITLGKLAEVCDLYLNKGKQISIEGRLRTRSWEKDGVKQYSTEIIASYMEMLGSKNTEKSDARQGIVTSDSADDIDIDTIPF